MTASPGRGAKSLSFAVRSREAEVATKKFNVFARWAISGGVNLEDAVSEVFLESESHLNRVRMNSHRILDTAVRPRAELAA